MYPILYFRCYHILLKNSDSHLCISRRLVLYQPPPLWFCINHSKDRRLFVFANLACLLLGNRSSHFETTHHHEYYEWAEDNVSEFDVQFWYLETPELWTPVCSLCEGQGVLGLLVSCFVGFLVATFLGFKVSWFQSFSDPTLPHINFMFSGRYPYSRFSRFY